MQKLINAMFAKLDQLFTIFGGRNIGLLVVSLLITMFSLFFNESLLNNAAEKSVELAKLNRVVHEAFQLQRYLYKAESAQRGYLLTKEKEYVTPYDAAVKDSQTSLSALRDALLALSPVDNFQPEHVLLGKLSTDVGAKILEMNLTLELATKGKFNNAKDIVKLDGGLEHMTNINAHVLQLQALLNEHLQALYQERKFTRTIIRTSVIAGPLLLIFLVVMVIKQLLSELSNKATLQHQLAEENKRHEMRAMQQTKLLRSLALDYQADVERERQTLSRELHDEMGSILTASKMDIAWVIKRLKETHPDIVDKLKKTNGYLDQGINFKRQMVQALHPSLISAFGFWPALRTLIEDATERSQWALTLTLPDESTVLDETISLVAYRIVQETLNNCNKYAKATKVSIHMIHDAHYLKIEMQDNGIGLDLKSLTQKSHGLSGMRHRVLAIGGHFEMESSLGAGLLTRVMLPLDNQLVEGDEVAV
jgi:signal transduction histidine kinase